jgi:Uncharacterised conserved protein
MRTLSTADCSSAFHISIAWQLEEASKAEKERIVDIDIGNIQGMEIRFDTLKIKIGNSVKNLPLKEGSS